MIMEKTLDKKVIWYLEELIALKFMDNLKNLKSLITNGGHLILQNLSMLAKYLTTNLSSKLKIFLINKKIYNNKTFTPQISKSRSKKQTHQ
jgi:hypothetical protein